MLDVTICATPAGGDDCGFFAGTIAVAAGCVAGINTFVAPVTAGAGRVCPTGVIETGEAIGDTGVIGFAGAGLNEVGDNGPPDTAIMGVDPPGKRAVPRSHHINPTTLPINNKATSPR